MLLRYLKSSVGLMNKNVREIFYCITAKRFLCSSNKNKINKYYTTSLEMFNKTN